MTQNQKLEEVKAFTREVKWIFAKTYKDTYPHEYIVKTKLTLKDKIKFQDMVKYMIEYGFTSVWHDNCNPAIIVNGFKYWIMLEVREHTEDNKIIKKYYTRLTNNSTLQVEDYNNYIKNNCIIINRVEFTQEILD